MLRFECRLLGGMFLLALYKIPKNRKEEGDDLSGDNIDMNVNRMENHLAITEYKY